MELAKVEKAHVLTLLADLAQFYDYIRIQDLCNDKIVENLNKLDMPFQPAKIGRPNNFQTRPQFSRSGKEPSPINYRSAARAAPAL